MRRRLPNIVVVAQRSNYNPAMGLTHQRLMVKSSRTAKKAIKTDFLIDSGAIYSLVPKKQLASIGIKS
jgi:hypothetical protein